MSSEALFGIFPGLEPVHYPTVRRRVRRCHAMKRPVAAIPIEAGARFGHLTVVRWATYEEQAQRVGSHFVCSCDCGTRHTVKRGNSLRSGHVRTCGNRCRFYRPSVMTAVAEAARIKREEGRNVRERMSGARYGALVVLGPASAEEAGRAKDAVRCQCDCGAVCVKRRWNLQHAAIGACRRSCAARLQLEACNASDSSGAIPRQASEAAE